MIGIVNYGLGNIHAFLDCYRILGIPAIDVSSPDQLTSCDKLILPGVGSFGTAMQRLSDSGLREPINDMVCSENIDVLGVCVGLQMLFSKSDEGSEQGLGWIQGEVHKLEAQPAEGQRIPHLGWNRLNLQIDSLLMNQIENPTFYFLHSYFVSPQDSDTIIATCEYGTSFAAAVNLGSIWGVQFHPEKSHKSGLKLLENFASL